MLPFEGIILIDKPQDFTSFDVVAKMRGMAKTKKVGHAGTLDPMATGVLPIFFGRSTKAVDILPNHDKAYRAKVKLGIVTDTQDITGKTIKTSDNIPTLEKVRETIKEFVGEQKQLPPMYSAVQVDGVRLYDLARQGIEVERETRDIEIFSIEYICGEKDEFVIDVHCSKGSYIRTLCFDIGEKLGCGATLMELRRTMASGFKIEECITLEQAQKLTEEGNLQEKLIPLNKVFEHLPKITLSPKDTAHYLNGVRMTAKRFNVSISTGDIAIFDENETLLGISYVDEKGFLRIKKQFVLIG
ncbi:MAG: tRNA pseudouridine(55) synthase TruB [Oscillospiraceae bacterium]